MNREIRFGSRDSALAIAQAHLIMDPIARAHPELRLRLVTMKTHGDLHPELPLGQVVDGLGAAGQRTVGQGTTGPASPGKALFTGTLEQALADGEIDLCVHSLKDMSPVVENFPIIAFSTRGDPRDVLVLPKGRIFEGFERLERGLHVGSSSLRRRLQFQALAPGITVAPIRGNVPTRLAKMDDGQYSALMLAAAGLERLRIRDREAYVFSVEEMIPAAGQGTLAVQGRRGEDYGFLDTVRDRVSAAEAEAEQTFIRTLDCGCGSPAAVYAKISGSEIRITALFATDAESPLFRDEISGDRETGLRLAEELARRLLQKGQGQ
ncbi:porphobilinogen deaminase [Spirochaetia bacterium]|nr:porphobilinogen deaminase [Spirochaetia bacterium]